LIITGRFEEATALELVQKYLGGIPRPARRLDATYTEEPPQDGERNVVLRRVGNVASVAAAYHVPAAAHPDWAPLSILASVLTEAKVGRLESALVESKLATSVSARSDNTHDPGLFFVSAQPAEGKLEEVKSSLLGTMENLASEPFSTEAVERAKLRAHRATENLLTNASSMAQALSSASALGDWRLLFLQRDRVAAVTVDDVNRVARTYFQPHNRTVGVFIPAESAQRLEIPAVRSIAEVVKDYKGGEAVSAGEAFDPSPENLDARTSQLDLDGIRVALLPKKNRGETVSMILTLRYGNADSLRNLETAAGFLPSMLMAGTTTLDRLALQ
jgi:zinc protease